MTILLIVLVAVLAFANGSNDNCKGVATLVGFGAAKPLQALIYATATTAVGGLVSFFVAKGLLKSFTGDWLFIKGVVLDQKFYIAVLVGACGWVLLATKTGMPVSTTHAIVGALTGSGLMTFGNSKFQWAMLGQRFALPLALGPILSLATVYIISWPVLFILSRWINRKTATAPTTEPTQPASLTQSASPTANAIHWLTCGLISFARGWNDTPKIVALSLLGLQTTSHATHATPIGFAIVTLAMAAGGLLVGKKVLETLSKKVTPLPLAESLTASAVSASLVALASWHSLPVSTTHVTTGAIVGAGLKNNPAAVHWHKVGEIVLSWFITLPVAALIALIAKLILR